MQELLTKNQTTDVLMSFAKGTMKDVPGHMWYDFGAKLLIGQDHPELKKLAGDSFITGVLYSYSGELPAQD